jgi:hypothetical protein
MACWRELAEIETEHPRNTNPERDRYSGLLGENQ